MKRVWLSILVLVSGLSITCNVMADYSVNWFNVGTRSYEEGNDYHRLDFELTDENGNYPATNILESINLIGPGGNTIELTDLIFTEPYPNGYDSGYNGYTGTWYFSGYDYLPSGYKANLPNNLVSGIYTIEIADIYGNSYSATDEFSGKKRLPIIHSASIKIRYDNNGNLLVRWAGVSPNLPYLVDPDLETGIRVCIGSDDSWWQMSVPAHMSSAFIPKYILDEIRSIGSGHWLKIQYRDNDSDNRTYSSAVSLP